MLSAVFLVISLQGKDKPAEKSPLSDSLHKGEENLLWVSDCIIYAASAFAVVAVVFCQFFKEFPTNSTGNFTPAFSLSKPISPPLFETDAFCHCEPQFGAAISTLSFRLLRLRLAIKSPLTSPLC